jgi:hypothetical protein
MEEKIPSPAVNPVAEEQEPAALTTAGPEAPVAEAAEVAEATDVTPVAPEVFAA